MGADRRTFSFLSELGSETTALSRKSGTAKKDVDRKIFLGYTGDAKEARAWV
jgi:hypothetical protein